MWLNVWVGGNSVDVEVGDTLKSLSQGSFFRLSKYRDLI